MGVGNHGSRSRVVCLWSIVVSTSVAACWAGKPVNPRRLYELARPLWEPKNSGGFMREWLICGGFPNPPHEGDTIYNHMPPCVGLETDYLKEHGGEAAIRPREGMTHTKPDGTTVQWKAYKSEEDRVDFLEAFDEYWIDNAVGYAFTALTQPAATRTFLGIGSDDGIRVWVNGKLVHEHLEDRASTPDTDIVPVDLKAGENTILLKVETGSGPWDFYCRLLPDPMVAAIGKPFEPKVVSDFGASPLVVRPEAVFGARPGQLGSVTVEVVRPGGEVIATAQAHGAKLLEFPTDDWPEGPCEVRCTRSLGFGQRRVKYLPWFHGDARPLLRRLKRAAEGRDPNTQEGMVYGFLADFIKDKMSYYGSSASVWDVLLDPLKPAVTGEGARDEDTIDQATLEDIHSALFEFEELQLAATGGASLVRPGGFVRLAYRDEIDDSPQFCRAYLPADYDPTRKYPLIVHLHRADTMNPKYVEWEDVDRRHHWWADEHGLIVLVPHGRGDSWFKGIGLKDVLRCMAMAQERFSVDEDRVYLTGRSMGGGGVWEIGTRYPQLFAAIAPVYGGWDDRIFATASEESEQTPRQRFTTECYASFSGAESLLTTPVLINHGTDDTYVNVNHSRLIVRMMQRWGYDVRYFEHAEKGHEVWSDDQLGHEPMMLEWLLSHTRVAHPRRVRMRAGDLKSASVHWVRVENREDPEAFIIVDAEVVAQNLVRLSTENALAVTLSPSGDLVDPSKPLKVEWNGRDMPEKQLVDGKATFHAPGYAPGPLTKRPELEGPLSDVVTTPFALVVGTISEDADMRDACRRRADDFIANWNKQYHCKPRVVDDTELTEADKLRYSLILIGGPADNQVTRQLIDKLPVRLEGDTIVLDGKSFDAPNTLLSMVYPHPLNEQRYVRVTAATSADAMEYKALSKDALGFVLAEGLDFYLTDGKKPDEKGGRPEEKVFLASGHFDYNWRYSDELTVLGDPTVRQKAPQQGEYSYTPHTPSDPYDDPYDDQQDDPYQRPHDGMDGQRGPGMDGAP